MSNVIEFTPIWRNRELTRLECHGYPPSEAEKVVDLQEAIVLDRAGLYHEPIKSTCIFDTSREEIMLGFVNGIFTMDDIL